MLRGIAIFLGALVAILFVAIIALQAPDTWETAEVLRTPEEHFEGLPDYPFAPNFVDALGYRVHYVDEGPKDGEVILLMHGQPTWSYLYRHMIPPLAEQSYRVIVPDLVGFGKSDKPLRQSDHSHQMHVDVMNELVRQLELEGVTMFAQDWGGLIGLRMVADEPDRYQRLMLSNTDLVTGGPLLRWIAFPLFRLMVWLQGEPDSFANGKELNFPQWVAWAKTVEDWDYAGLIQFLSWQELSEEDLAPYSAPYPDDSYQAGPRVMPYIVATQVHENTRAYNEVFANWDKPLITAFADKDPIFAGREMRWQEDVPGAKGQPHVTVMEASHFIQEDQPEELVRILIDFVERNPP